MTIRNRIARLEAETPAHAAALRCVLRSVVMPDAEGPRNLGPRVARFIGGETLWRGEGESADEFMARVEESRP